MTTTFGRSERPSPATPLAGARPPRVTNNTRQTKRLIRNGTPSFASGFLVRSQERMQGLSGSADHTFQPRGSTGPRARPTQAPLEVRAADVAVVAAPVVRGVLPFVLDQPLAARAVV